MKHWRSLAKKEARAAKEAGDAHVPVVERPEAAFIPSLLDEFLEVRRGLAGAGMAAAPQRVRIMCLPCGRYNGASSSRVADKGRRVDDVARAGA